MKTFTKQKEKKAYTAPEIQRILLDNEISLILQSVPDGDPWSTKAEQSEQQLDDPFKTQIG